MVADFFFKLAGEPSVRTPRCGELVGVVRGDELTSECLARRGDFFCILGDGLEKPCVLGLDESSSLNFGMLSSSFSMSLLKEDNNESNSSGMVSG